MGTTRLRPRPTTASHHPPPNESRTAPAELGKVEEEKKLTPDERGAIIARANKGDREAFDITRTWSKSLTREEFKDVGITKVVRTLIACRVCGEDALHAQHRMKRESEMVAESLLGPNPSPLESLLAEQISLNWLVLRAAETALEVLTKFSCEEGAWHQARVASAHSRFMASIRTLAQIRKLQLPTLLQVNIAEKQVNVAP